MDNEKLITITPEVMNTTKGTSIRISKSTIYKLKILKKPGESYNDLLLRIMEIK